MRWSSWRMRSTRSSALRCPSWRRNTLTICSRLLERLPPSGFSRLRSGRSVIHLRRKRLRLHAERAAAAAGRCRVRVLDREAAAGHRVDEIDLSPLEVADADRIDEELHAIRLEHLVAGSAAFLDHQAVLESRASAALHEHTQAAAGLSLFRQQLADFRRGCRGHIHHNFDSPGDGGAKALKKYKRTCPTPAS